MSVRVLFVCMGNICRSPTAHALFREAVTAAGLDDEITTDSAGTHAYHIGNPPDARATATAVMVMAAGFFPMTWVTLGASQSATRAEKK